MAPRLPRRTAMLGAALTLTGCVGDIADDSQPSHPGYADHDFAFGLSGYEAEASFDYSLDENAPFECDVDVAGDAIDGEDDVAFSFELTNRSREPVSVSARDAPPNPFGRFLLADGQHVIHGWTPTYVANPWVQTDSHLGIVGWNDYAESVSVDPGETIRETYTISEETHRIRPGSYVYDGAIEVRESDGTRWEVNVEGTLTLESNAHPDGEAVHDLVVSDMATPADGFPGEFSVEPLEPVADVHPGLVAITLANTGDESIRSTTNHGPIATYVSDSGDGSDLVLLSEDMYAPGHVDRDDDGWWYPAFVPPERGDRGGGVDLGDSYTKRYVVTAYPDDPTPEDGETFRFDQSVDVGDEQFSWWFELATQAPGS